MRFRLFFNLLAELVKRINELNTPPIISAESEETTFSIVNSFLTSKIGNINELSHDTIPLDSQIIRDIISWSEEKDNYWVYKIMISILESKIDLDLLVNYFDVNMLSGEPAFESLNTNVDSTCIIILPNLFSPTTKHEHEQNNKKMYIVRSTAQKFFNSINNGLEKCFYIPKNRLNGYRLKNVIISMPEQIFKEGYITIGVTPICNSPLKETLSYTVTQKSDRMGNVSEFFRDVNIRNPKEITYKYCNAYRMACKYDVDILLGPEMLGTRELNEVIGEFNSLYEPSNPAEKTPSIIIPPTYWNDSSNKLNVFSRTGELIGSQNKQYPYVHESKYTEELKDSKQILLLHIKGVGRMAFPICVDYLNTDYRDLLTRILHADFLICPSYSSGTSLFDEAVTAPLEFGVRSVWLNSCSAIAEAKEAPDYIGIISTPIVTKDSPKQYLIPKCNGNCHNGCLFTLKIPLNCANNEPGRKHEDNKVAIEHYLE